MTQEQVERLLNTACEMIIELEAYADEDQKFKIEALFQEIKYSDELYTEEQLHNDLVWNENGIGKHLHGGRGCGLGSEWHGYSFPG